MKILHILDSGHVGGIEKLCLDIAMHSEHHFCFFKKTGTIYNEMKANKLQICSVFEDEVKYNIFKILPAYRKIKKYLEVNNIKNIVVHTNSIFAWFIIILLKRNNYKIALYAHTNYYDLVESKSKKSRIKKLLFPVLLKRVEKIIAISYSVKESIESKIKGYESKICVIYNGIKLNSFSLSNQTFEAGDVNLIYVGRLIKEKGVQNILYLLSNIRNGSYRLRIVGDGEYRCELERLAKKLNIQNRVDFLGQRRDIPQLLSTSHVFIHLPEWEEGFGITVIEAMASGLVCVVNDKGAMKELIKDNIDGYILEENNQTEKLIMILNNIVSNLSGEIKIKAKEKSAKFSIENTIKEIENIFK